MTARSIILSPILVQQCLIFYPFFLKQPNGMFSRGNWFSESYEIVLFKADCIVTNLF